jgi:hypothetical protein
MDHKETVAGCGLDLSASGCGPVMDPYELDNEPLSFLKVRKFLE